MPRFRPAECPIARPSVRVSLIAAVAGASLIVGSAALLASDGAISPPQPAPGDDWTALNARLTKLERLTNTPPLPPDPTVAAHAATTQPDVAANVDAPTDVKQALRQIDARVDAVARRLTLLEQRAQNPVAADERDQQIRQLTQIIEDQRRTARDLEERVHRLEQRNSH